MWHWESAVRSSCSGLYRLRSPWKAGSEDPFRTGRPGISDPAFHGDRSRYNPEQLLLTALSQCHMLSFLHVAVKHGVVVTDYVDHAEGLMRLNRDGSGQFESVTLKPQVTVADPAHISRMDELHHEANQVCFIARSVNFPVLHEPSMSAGAV